MIHDRRSLLSLALSIACLRPLRAQDDTDFIIEKPHPRLLLTSRRLRLLRRERERRTMRWMQLETLITGNAAMPEPGFANALYYAAGGGHDFGREAVRWALKEGGDIRQIALVFDWCQELLTPVQRQSLTGKLKRLLEKLATDDSFAGARGRILAAIALTSHDDELSEAVLRETINGWWRGKIIRALKAGETAIHRDDSYALMEILHVVRDNLQFDLRKDYQTFFISLATYFLLTYYPAIYPAPENEFHIPVVLAAGAPDLRAAALARAADLSLSAYDPNALEPQFLQGWSMQDQLIMRGAYGITYEFLWANPYLPGLSYHSAPTVLHDPRDGRLLVRSGWEGNAAWFYHEDGVMQTFEAGAIQQLNWKTLTAPMELGETIVVPMRETNRFSAPENGATTIFLIGLVPRCKYDIEIDDEELYEEHADAGGIIVINRSGDHEFGMRLRPSPEGGM